MKAKNGATWPNDAAVRTMLPMVGVTGYRPMIIPNSDLIMAGSEEGERGWTGALCTETGQRDTNACGYENQMKSDWPNGEWDVHCLHAVADRACHAGWSFTGMSSTCSHDHGDL